MRNYILRKLTGLALLAVVVAGCDTASQEVEPVISPDNYPVATFTTDFTGETVNEGETISYVISVDKQLDKSITFHVIPDTGNVADDHDYAYEPAVLQPYTSEVTMDINFPLEDIVEDSESFSFEIGATSLADKYLLNPSTENPTHDLTVVNVNDPTLLTINFEWYTDEDIDIVTWSDTDTYPMTPWGDGGATGSNPEIDKSIWLADPPGDYYVNIMDWGVESFDYTFKLGFPDGTNQVITGTFVRDDYQMDLWTAWGGDGYASYRVLKVNVSASGFTVTEL
ncbi:MAG: hypothetical protein K9G38_01375 [Bacteroidales bacterium]|nr:hypothetical protein [Bacteroidales bacterium]